MTTPHNIPSTMHQTSDPWAVPTDTSRELLAAGPAEVKPAPAPTRHRNSDSCPICQATGACPPGAIHR